MQGDTFLNKQFYNEKVSSLIATKNNTYTFTEWQIVSDQEISVVCPELSGNISSDSNGPFNMETGYVNITSLNSKLNSSWKVKSFTQGYSMTLSKEEPHNLTFDEVTNDVAIDIKHLSGAFATFNQGIHENYANYTSILNNQGNKPGIHVYIRAEWNWINGYSYVPYPDHSSQRSDNDNQQRYSTVCSAGLFQDRTTIGNFGLNPTSMVVTHELGHHFGMSHNHYENGETTLYKGHAKTNYLQGSNYHLMESFLGAQNKPFDSIFD